MDRPVRLRDRLLNPVVVIVWFLMAILLFAATNLDAAGSDQLYAKIRLFSEVLGKLNENYYQPVDYDSLLDGAINGMLEQLDPHTQYFTPVQAESFLTEMQGEFGGFGVSIEQEDGKVVVLEVTPGYSAEKVGILPGDRIVKVDGLSVVGLPMEQVFSIFRGPAGTHALVSVERPGLEQELVFDIERKIIAIKNIPYAFKFDNGIGYIRVREFAGGIAAQMREQLDRLESLGIRGLVVDMRYNPGGSLDEAVDMVNEFIGPNKLVVSSKGKSERSNEEYYTKFNRVRSGYPVIVLVNRYSASAAEIFAGSLQDYDVALVMGETSFGKGSVQTMFPLSTGMIKITIAHYYLASGRCIHREENDRVLRGRDVTDAEQARFDERRKTDVHYTQKGRIVYGGGGITPDIAIDPMTLTELGVRLRNAKTIGAFGAEYAKSHEVGPDFVVTDAIRQQFLAFAREKGIVYTEAELDSSRFYIDTALAGVIVGEKNGEEAGFKAQVPIDRQLVEAFAMIDRFPDLDSMLQYAETLKKGK